MVNSSNAPLLAITTALIDIVLLQSVDIRQIADKFPDKTGGLRELFEKGPQSAFFLVKFWVSSSCIAAVSFLLVVCLICVVFVFLLVTSYC